MEQELKINLPPELADGTYANLAVIAHSSDEFVIDFIRVVPQVQSPKVQSRVILTPNNAKKLLSALQENIRKYEQQYGKIDDKATLPSKDIPLSFGGGEA